MTSTTMNTEQKKCRNCLHHVDAKNIVDGECSVCRSIGGFKEDAPDTTMNESGHTYIARVLEKALQGAQENVWPRQNAQQHAGLIESAIVEHKELERQARELREALKTHEQWLVERMEWLRKEAHSGGNWEHLNTRMTESAYVLEKFRAVLTKATALAASEGVE